MNTMYFTKWSEKNHILYKLLPLLGSQIKVDHPSFWPSKEFTASAPLVRLVEGSNSVPECPPPPSPGLQVGAISTPDLTLSLTSPPPAPLPSPPLPSNSHLTPQKTSLQHLQHLSFSPRLSLQEFFLKLS